MRQALGKTLGVPLFQEQMMQIAIDCGFSLRRRPTGCARR
jgi:error-prone DNA polymerase